MLPIPPPPKSDPAPSGGARPLTRRRLFWRWAIVLSILLLVANSPQGGTLKGEWAGFPLVFWSRLLGHESFHFDALMIDLGVWMACMWLAWLCAWSRFRSPPK